MAGQNPPHPPALPHEGTTLIPALSFARRNRHFTVPLALPVIFYATGFTLAAFPRARGEVIAAAAVAALAMHLGAPHKWDRRAEQWYARLSVVAAGAWLTAASFTGVTWQMWAALGAGTIAWGIPWFIHKRPRETRAAKGIIAEWNAWWQHHARDFDLPGSGVTDVTSKGTVETLRIQLWAGRQHVRQVEDAAHLIESALRGYVRAGMVRVAKDPRNPSQALVHLKRENPLAETIAWDASMVPLSVLETAVIGLGEEGGWLRVVLAANWFILGRSRSGKSNELSLFLAAITGCEDALVWLIDRKGGRAARPWMPALDWCAVTLEEARIVLETAVAEVEARSMYAYDGTEQLRPTVEVPAVFVIIDETHEVTSLSRGDGHCASLLAALASMGMGVAFYTIVLTQYGALDESVRTEQTRSNLPNRICFAVTRADHGAFALTDYARLDASRLREKGSFYCQLGPHADSAPVRAPEMTHELVGSISARNGAMPRRPLMLYARDRQPAYDTRWSRLPEVFRPLAPQSAGAPPAPEEISVDTDPQRAFDQPRGTLGMSGAAERVEADVAAIPDADITSLRVPSDEEIRGEVGRRKARFARALMNAPQDGISPDQLVQATGLSRSWVHQQLAALTDRGSVIKVGRGAYQGAAEVSVWDEMEALRTGNDRLLAQAG